MSVPAEPGRDTAAILEAAANREIAVLFLVGVDPLRDYPDARLARRALENVPYKVVVDVSADAMASYADVMLPAAPYLEKDGHYTDWEGRSQRLRPVRPPLGLARSEWEIFQELSEVMGRDMGFGSLDALHEEMRGLFGSGTMAPAEVGPPPRRSRSLDSAGGPRSSPPERGAATAHPVDPAAPPPDGPDSITLFSYPLLVDEGRLSVGAETLKAALEESAFVEVHPSDAKRLRISHGSVARITTEAGTAELPVRVSDGMAQGVGFVPWNQPGLAANTLLSGRSFTRATLEPAKKEVPA